MTRLTKLTTFAAVTLSAVLALPSNAAADKWNDLTVLTFSEPVMIPRATLQPGTYTFKLADVDGNRHVVQIYKGERDELVTTSHAVPVRREQPDGIPF